MSGASDSGATAVKGNKDGIPCWSGEAGSFVEYEEAALLWEQSLTWEKRYTAGPRLVQELSGAARRFVAGQSAGWVAYRGGVKALMDHLRKALGKPRVNEVTDLLALYFKGTKRKANESMNEYITRKTEAYMRASQALKRAKQLRYYEWMGPATEEPGTNETEASTEATANPETGDTRDDQWQTRWNTWGASSWGRSPWGGYGSWGSQPWQGSSWGASSTSSSPAPGLPDLLPSFIQGWYLLADSNLDHAEKNIVLTALGGDFAPQKVAQELRNQFPEGEVRRRDQRRYQSYIGEAVEDSGDEEAKDYSYGFSIEELSEGGMNEEGIALVVDYEETAREAMAALHQAKRTLKEARQKQHSVKQSRKYYQGKPGPATSSTFKPRDDSNIDCLRCGQRGHRAANCPVKPLAAQAENTTGDNGGPGPQQAPFVCYHDKIPEDYEHVNGFAQGPETESATEAALSIMGAGAGLTTQEAVSQGLCVVDGGATQTVGSVAAVEAILAMNKKKHGSNRLTAVSTSDPPTFSFGNSTENKCLSTASLKVSAGGNPGELRIHTLDHGQSPVLLSVEALRNLGAIIDFKADLVAFRHLDVNRIIPLGRSKTGHQLLPLTDDWMANACATTRPVPSLTEFLRELKWLVRVMVRVPLIMNLRMYQWEPEDGKMSMFRIAAILALKQAVLQDLPIFRAAMDKLTKPELILHLRALGETPPEEWTRLELRQRLSDLADQGEVAIETSKTMKTPLQNAVAELNRASSRKATLVNYVQETYGMKVGTNDTIAIIQKNCMSHMIRTIEGHDNDRMGFGKHSQKTYLEVLETDENYCQWAKQTATETGCSIYLQRFVTWMNNRATTEVKKKLVIAKKKTSKMGEGYPEITPKAKAITPKHQPSTTASASSTDVAVAQLAQMVATLTEEVKSLKEGQPEKPRKVTVRDQDMPNQAPKAQDCIHYLQEGWVQYFGHPRCLRLDPAGAFRSAAIEEWCDRHNIFLDIVPGEAHWKIGTCENAIKGVKTLLDKLSLQDDTITPQEALAEAVVVFNQKDLIRGFSPAQHVLGQAPDNAGRFQSGCQQVPPGLLVEDPAGDFERSVQRRLEAEKCLLEWQARQRLSRATNSKHRPCYDYVPGELVYYWRTQDSNKGRRQPGGKHGRFLGPARVLATESRRDPSGDILPGGAIWLVKGRSLLKCSPEQLRRASEREEMIETLAAKEGQATPWTFHSVAASIGGNRFEDLTGDLPDLREWRRAQDTEEEVQPSRFRIRQKRPAEGLPTSQGEEDPELLPEQGEAPSSSRRPRLQEPDGENQMAWWATISEDKWPQQRAGYWDDKAAAVALEISFPETQRGIKKALQDLPAYFVGSLKRRAIELSEKRMTPEERDAFNSAKAVEVKNFVASKAFEALPDHLKPAKARAVLLGYQDGDVTGAFLQSRQYPDELFCIPCPEICRALDLPEGSVTRVKKACYGLVDAPLEWYRSVDQFLKSLGFQRLWSDSCCWVLRENGELRGIVSGHVDDFLFGGKDGDPLWEAKVQAIKDRFKWGDWEQNKFTQCGVVVEQTSSGFELSQPHYLDSLHEIGVNASRKKDKSQPTTDKEKSQLRALLGGISWHAQQVAPYLAAEVGLLLTEVTRSSVDTIIRANMLLAAAKSKQHYRMKIHAFDKDQELVLIAWVDAANGNRMDGGSTQGILLGMSTSDMLKGSVQPVSPVGWHSQRIDRTCRSPGAAEAQAAVNGEDHLHAARYQWSEILYGGVNLSAPDETVRKTRGCVVTDSRNVYDKLETEVMVIKGAEKRTSLELLSLKEAQANTNVCIRWVHSEAQLANTLTKSGGGREHDLFDKMGHTWRLVEDEKMMSARRRKEIRAEALQRIEKGCPALQALRGLEFLGAGLSGHTFGALQAADASLVVDAMVEPAMSAAISTAFHKHGCCCAVQFGPRTVEDAETPQAAEEEKAPRAVRVNGFQLLGTLQLQVQARVSEEREWCREDASFILAQQTPAASTQGLGAAKLKPRSDCFQPGVLRRRRGSEGGRLSEICTAGFLLARVDSQSR
ncbi:RE2 [Symbiodinium sp. CCMP2592]|nr:RE2 [Symbiodinium sp. CCMP2592]